MARAKTIVSEAKVDAAKRKAEALLKKLTEIETLERKTNNQYLMLKTRIERIRKERKETETKYKTALAALNKTRAQYLKKRELKKYNQNDAYTKQEFKTRNEIRSYYNDR